MAIACLAGLTAPRAAASALGPSGTREDALCGTAESFVEFGEETYPLRRASTEPTALNGQLHWKQTGPTPAAPVPAAQPVRPTPPPAAPATEEKAGPAAEPGSAASTSSSPTSTSTSTSTSASSPPSAPAPSSAPKNPPPKRPLPDYDGRGDPPTSVGDVVRGVGRVLLFLPRIVVDYGLRWPIGYAVRTVEHSRSARAAFRYVFLQPPAPTMSIVPIAFYDFGFQSSLGVRMLWTDGFLTKGSRASIKLGTGGRDWWRADTSLSVAAPYGLRVGADFGLRNRPDQQFFGIGPDTPQRALARYTHTRTNLALSAGRRELQVFVASVIQIASESHFSDDASIDDQVAAGRIAAAPDGYKELLVTRRLGARVALDSRRDAPESEPPSSGVRFDAVLERVRDEERGAWTHFDGTLGAALVLDPAGEYKLDLRTRVELVAAARDVALPFLELASVGGSRDLRGFGSGRGRDRSAFAMSLDYQWPLAAWLDATAYLSVGNVFGENLAGFHAGALRGTAGLGLGLAGLTGDRQIELWAATGTEPLGDGLDLAGFRLVLGYTHDY